MKAHPLPQLLQLVTDCYLNFESSVEIKGRFRIFTLLAKEGGSSSAVPKGAETSVCCSWKPQTWPHAPATRTLDRRRKGTGRSTLDVRGGGRAAHGPAQGSAHLPLGHEVGHAGFRQKPLLATFLE